MRKAPGPQSLKVELVVWIPASIIHAITGRAITAWAAALLMVGSIAPLSSPSHAEKRQGQSRASQPRVSPDGRRIAFVSRLAGGDSGLYVVDADGTHLRRLTDGYGDMHAWSSDGSKLVFVR